MLTGTAVEQMENTVAADKVLAAVIFVWKKLHVVGIVGTFIFVDYFFFRLGLEASCWIIAALEFKGIKEGIFWRAIFNPGIAFFWALYVTVTKIGACFSSHKLTIATN